METISEKPKRGFAAMSPEKRREIAKQGGRAVHEQGRAHRFTPEETQLGGLRRYGRPSTAEDNSTRSS
jgi:general stress protein YciG